MGMCLMIPFQDTAQTMTATFNNMNMKGSNTIKPIRLRDFDLSGASLLRQLRLFNGNGSTVQVARAGLITMNH